MASPSLLFRIDAALCLSCNRTSRNRLVRWAFRRISRLGNGVFWYLLMAMLFAFDGSNAVPTALRMLGAGGAGVLAYK